MRKNILLVLALVIILVLVLYIWRQARYRIVDDTGTGQVACTLDAKICPDGSAVGRIPPSCEFAACPESSIASGYAIDTQNGIRFVYPVALPTTYITTQDRPGTLRVQSGTVTCAEPVHTLSDREYCVQTQNEGTAGSIYIASVYSRYFAEQHKTVSLEFVIRAVQCGNYDEQEATVCEQERETFDLDIIVDGIFESMEFGL